jgi:2'-5' RNA ligase
VYSLNVPLPSDVSALATELARQLSRARPRQRGDHTLVAKRLGTGDRGVFQRRRARVREVLAGAPAFDARIAGVDCFETPPTGAAPVAYLTVESPGLEALHARLCERFDPVEGIEGEEYRPHVTIARGGDIDAAKRLTRRDVDPIEWTVSELYFFDADRGQQAGSLSLPA